MLWNRKTGKKWRFFLFSFCKRKMKIGVTGHISIFRLLFVHEHKNVLLCKLFYVCKTNYGRIHRVQYVYLMMTVAFTPNLNLQVSPVLPGEGSLCTQKTLHLSFQYRRCISRSYPIRFLNYIVMQILGIARVISSNGICNYHPVLDFPQSYTQLYHERNIKALTLAKQHLQVYAI